MANKELMSNITLNFRDIGPDLEETRNITIRFEVPMK